jgi:hypothetical protein
MQTSVRSGKPAPRPRPEPYLIPPEIVEVGDDLIARRRGANALAIAGSSANIVSVAHRHPVRGYLEQSFRRRMAGEFRWAMAHARGSGVDESGKDSGGNGPCVSRVCAIEHVAGGEYACPV